MVEIVEKIDLNKLYEALTHPESGGICVFVGTVRNRSNDQQVNELYFEAYDEMAITEMEKIRQKAIAQWRLNRAAIFHAKGSKKIGEMVVALGVSSAHRKESFEACEFLINELKKTVPIWKKEFYSDHTSWISPTP